MAGLQRVVRICHIPQYVPLNAARTVQRVLIVWSVRQMGSGTTKTSPVAAKVRITLFALIGRICFNIPNYLLV